VIDSSPILENLNALIFYFPLGFIGAWRWGVWVFKKLGALKYKPIKGHYKSSVSIITPVYNENPNVFLEALKSWDQNKPTEIISVIDYTDKQSIKTFKDFAKGKPYARFFVTKTPGKRPALAKGISVASSEIVALVDSDTIWSKNLLRVALAPFKNPSIGGVATRQKVLNPNSLAQKLFDIQLDQRYTEEMPFLSGNGSTLTCISGRTAIYRRSLLLPILGALVNETFWGTPVISGEDKRLTYMIQANGWKTAYQKEAVVFTPGEENLRTFLKQRLRWTRNSWRADLRAVWQGWVWKHPALAFFLVDRFIQPFSLLISPIYFLISIFVGLWIPALVIVIWWLVSRSIKIFPHFKEKPRDILILPMFIVYQFISGVIRIYALFSLNTQGWITRWDTSRLPRFNFIKSVPSYLASLLIVLSISSLIVIRNQQFLSTNLQVKGQEQHLIVDPKLEIANHEDAGANESLLENGLIIRHEVTKGDNLTKIAKKYGVSLSEVLKVNQDQLPNWNNLPIGLVLSIPRKPLSINRERLYSFTRKSIPPLSVSYDQKLGAVKLVGRGNIVTIPQISKIIGQEYLEDLGNGQWLLKSDLIISRGITLKIEGDGVKWLKLASSPVSFAAIKAYNSNIVIKNTKITSWNHSQNNFDSKHVDGRAFISVKNFSRMDVYNSEIAYLGYLPLTKSDTSSYGITWKLEGGTFGKNLLTGEVKNSKFHHNYFGAYTYGTTGMVWQNNELYENVQYGLGSHDDSNSFLVENNKFYRNGNHGLIFSKRCFSNVIRNNISFDNRLHGIMLDRNSNNNTIKNNWIYGNNNGIALYNSGNNLIAQNTISNNKWGIRANEASVKNLFTKNNISGSSVYGIYLYEEANENFITYNKLEGNKYALYIKTKENHVTANTITQNKVGVYLLDNADKNLFIKNYFGGNGQRNVYPKTRTGIKNFFDQVPEV